MKVLIIDSTDVSQAPYLQYYTDVLEREQVDYDILSWEKDQSGPTTHEDRLIQIHKKMHLGGFKKLLEFFSVARAIKKEIKKGKYTHFIIINTIWAVLLIDVLSSFKKRYILDVRDYKCEEKSGYRHLLKYIMEHAFANVVSSKGFIRFLPVKIGIVPAHNLTKGLAPKDLCTLDKHKEKINIGFAGYVRYNEPNEYLIESLKTNPKFELHYYGTVSRYCDFYKKYKGENVPVFMHGLFKNEDKERLHQEIDIINSLYGADDLTVITLVPNRLYDSLNYYIPMIVSAHTYLAEVVEEYGLGLVIDTERDDLQEKLNKYIETFDKAAFVEGCEKLAAVINEEQDEYIHTIDRFVTSGK